MNLLLLFEADRLDEARFLIDGPRAVHLRRVLRVQPGQQLKAGLLNGPIGTAIVERLHETDERIELSAALTIPPMTPLIDLILAVPRPKSLQKLLPEITALGVRRLTLIRTWRVERPYLSTQILQPAKYRPLLHDGLMQARATMEPEVVIEPLFKPFVEDRLPELLVGRRGMVAHPGAPAPLAAQRVQAQDKITLAIGPEGGFIPYEVETLERAGMLPVSSGDRILRVETACVALLAQLTLLRAQALPLKIGPP